VIKGGYFMILEIETIFQQFKEDILSGKQEMHYLPSSEICDCYKLLQLHDSLSFEIKLWLSENRPNKYVVISNLKAVHVYDKGIISNENTVEKYLIRKNF
jgi:hypothetical protein